MQEPINPYSAPCTDGPPVPASEHDQAQLEALRTLCVKREANIKSIGFLFWLGAAAVGLGALFLGGGVPGLPIPAGFGLLALVFFGGLALLYALIGRWLRRLENKGRIAATILFGLSIAANVLQDLSSALETGSAYLAGRATGGMVLPVIALVILWSKPSETVFTEHYRNVVVPATPHIKHRSVLALVVLGVLLLGLVMSFLRGVSG